MRTGLSAVSFCDSVGLDVLLWAWRQAEGAGSVLVPACVPPNLQRMLSMTGVDSVLRVYDTVAEAEAALVVGWGPDAGAGVQAGSRAFRLGRNLGRG